MTTEKQRRDNGCTAAWHVYIISCRDNSYYTGITTDLTRRIEEHNSSAKGARYTRSRRPVELVYHERVASRSIAAKRELQIKKLTLAEKKLLIKTSPPNPDSSIKQPNLF